MGPLSGIRIVELAGIGPGPFCAMLLADLGADVIRVDRLGAGGGPVTGGDPLLRSRRSAAVDLKRAEGVETVMRLVEAADALIEGFRPGVTERLGLGPEECLARNPRLVYGRMTGWGQDGPLAHAAGHDINYIAITGALAAIARRGEKPMPPLNLVGDFGGGALYLAMGLLAALLEAKSSGKGQVVDAAMCDGAASLMTMFYGMRASGFWTDEPGTNLLDTGAHFYDVFETKDGKHVAIGSIEPQFYALLLEKTGLSGDAEFANQFDRSKWPALKEKLEAVFRTKTRQEWCDLMEGTDVCFAPVLTLEEAPDHPHNAARNIFVDVAGVRQPAPAPRFDRTPCATPSAPAAPGADTREALTDWGFSPEEIDGLVTIGAIG